MQTIIKKHIKKKGFFYKLWPLYLGIFIVLLLLGILYLMTAKDLPSPSKLSNQQSAQSTLIYDRNGKLLFKIYREKDQIFVPLNTIPKQMQQATIAIEDRNFYTHGAIDLRGITRAAYSTIFHKELQGGSTLTQQLVKNTLL
ncbi:transglycosylase domain-containing protein, partial [Patescibacteria group bacterium]|nr:transglycosylase domain-containing protein [Patescibacteria group bacterium]